ncbi:hypothetical protein BJ973_005153 [Actinoplanes tereljensis]|uniref:GmrSD restriction endonucleases N-terminal domain-containing protein n=1 Tax=Paractinoplanes tereljensis TaxID=571912 RepID=A0A919NMA5_9ACTN|nr:DUF262 domain-containing protein [Actinoplanes tereljensis]GIF21400.1 hypothetical protein Ate02nite_41300 [Actinoplanes tereljensis]
MLSDDADSRLAPSVELLSDILEDIARGLIRVPKFQRPFVWRPEQMLDLFDSIERGYPIGSILLWETTENVLSLSSVGEVEVPPPPLDRPASYVLDGHQRLSTLFGVLRRLGRTPRFDDQREWKWRIYRDLDLKEHPSRDRYRHFRAEGSSPARVPETLMPVRAVAGTIDFLRFSRNLELQIGDGKRLERLINEADQVASRLRSYKLAVIKLRGGSLNEAVEVYTRLNRRGVRMEADQVVSALTHRSDQPTMAEHIETIVEAVANTEFGELPRTAVFRSILAVAGEVDVMSPRWELVADRMQKSMATAVPKATEAIHAAVEFLQWAGLPLASLLPYAHQLVILTGFFHRCNERGAPPTGNERYELRRWFWVTSWAGSYAGATSTTLRRALQEMRDFADGRITRLALDVAAVQPVPDQFNLNSARTLAYVAWEAGEFRHRLDSLGQKFDVLQRLAAGAAQAYRPVYPRDPRPANRLVLPTPPGLRLETALRSLRDDLWGRASEILESHGIPEIAWQRMLDGDEELFLDYRARFLGEKLRAFAGDIGVELTRDLIGVADDDTEHE